MTWFFYALVLFCFVGALLGLNPWAVTLVGAVGMAAIASVDAWLERR